METFIRKYQLEEPICDDLIQYHSDNFEYRAPGKMADYKGDAVLDKNIKDSIDVLFFNYSEHPVIKKYFGLLNGCIQDYLKHYNLGPHETFVVNNLQYYPPGGGFKQWHCERARYGSPSYPIVQRALVYMTYLNDVNDEGETEFLYQQVKVKPKKGLTLIWPSDFTHTHRGIPSMTEEKYIATGWFNIL
tara:strand:+ start:918 stop:1484 length:567 start_codon:yes stop_codon:yes gene_type:complete